MSWETIPSIFLVPVSTDFCSLLALAPPFGNLRYFNIKLNLELMATIESSWWPLFMDHILRTLLSKLTFQMDHLDHQMSSDPYPIFRNGPIFTTSHTKIPRQGDVVIFLSTTQMHQEIKKEFCPWQYVAFDLLLLFSHQVMVNSLWPHGYSTPGFPVLHYLPEFAQIHVPWVSDSI